MSLGLDLKVAAQQQEGNDHADGFQIDVVHLGVVGEKLHVHAHAWFAGVAENHDIQRPEIGRGGAHGNERVHGKRAMFEVGPRGLVERRAAVDKDNRGQNGADPLPVIKLQGRNHGQCHDWDRQHSGHDGQTLQLCGFFFACHIGRGGIVKRICVLGCGIGIVGVVARTLDDLDEIFWCGQRGIIFH